MSRSVVGINKAQGLGPQTSGPNYTAKKKFRSGQTNELDEAKNRNGTWRSRQGWSSRYVNIFTSLVVSGVFRGPPTSSADSDALEFSSTELMTLDMFSKVRTESRLVKWIERCDDQSSENQKSNRCECAPCMTATTFAAGRKAVDVQPGSACDEFLLRVPWHNELVEQVASACKFWSA